MTGRRPTSTLFPYTTLFRSHGEGEDGSPGHRGHFGGSGREDRGRPQGHRDRVRAGDGPRGRALADERSEEHTSELQSQFHLVCRLLLEKKKDIGEVSLRLHG